MQTFTNSNAEIIALLVLLFVFGYKDTTFFHIYKLFLTFFSIFACDLSKIANFVCMLCLCSSLFRRSCVRWSPDNHTHAHTYARTRTRTGIFRPQFLDLIVIFRRAGIFIFSLPIAIFGTQTAIFRLQDHKFSIKSKIFFGYSIFMLTFASQTTSLTINFQSNENTHLQRGHK